MNDKRKSTYLGKTAEQAFNDEQAKVLKQLDELKATIKKYPNKSLNWGDFGSMAHVSELLAEATSFIKGEG